MVGLLLVVVACISILPASKGGRNSNGGDDGEGSDAPTLKPTPAPTTPKPTRKPITPATITPEPMPESTLPPTEMPTVHPTSGWYEMALYNNCSEGAIDVSVLFFNETDNLVCLEGLLLQYEEGAFLTERTQRPYFFTYAESVSGQHGWDGSELEFWDGSGELPNGATVKRDCGTVEPVQMAVANRVVRQNVLLMEFNC